MPLTDYLIRYATTPTDTTSAIAFDPNLYYEIFVTDYEDIIRRQVELDQAQCRWDALIFLHETASAVYGHICESNTVSPAMRTFTDSMGFTQHSSFAGLENLSDINQFRAGCEGLLSSIWENIKKFFKWIWEKIKGFFKAIKAFFMKVLAFFGLVDDKPTAASKTIKESTALIDAALKESGDPDKIAKINAKHLEGKESLSAGLESDSSIDTKKLASDIRNLMYKSLTTKFERTDEKDTAYVIEVVCNEALKIFNQLIMHGNINPTQTDLQSVAQLPMTVINKSLNRISDPILNQWTKEILTTYTVKLPESAVATLFYNTDSWVLNPNTLDISDVQGFYEKLTNVCTKYMKTCDRFSTDIDKIMFSVIDKLVSYSENLEKSGRMDTSTPSKYQQTSGAVNAVGSAIVNLQKMITPFTMVVTRSTSNTITTLTRVLREFYTECNSLVKLHKLSYKIRASRAKNLEREIELKRIDIFENINVYLEPSGNLTTNFGVDIPNDVWLHEPDFIQAMVAQGYVASNKICIIVSQGFKKHASKSTQNWLLMHELGHIERKDIQAELESNFHEQDGNTPKVLTSTMKQTAETEADMYACARYGIAVSTKALTDIHKHNAQFYIKHGIGGATSVADVFNLTEGIHPSANDRIAYIKKHGKKP